MIGIPKRVLTSPDLAAYVMAEGDDGEEGGRAEARRRTKTDAAIYIYIYICAISYSLIYCEKHDTCIHSQEEQQEDRALF